MEFAARAARPLPRENVERARDLIERLEELPDINEIPALLSGR